MFDFVVRHKSNATVGQCFLHERLNCGYCQHDRRSHDEFSHLVKRRGLVLSWRVGNVDQNAFKTFGVQTSSRLQRIRNRRDIVAVSLQHPDVVI